MGLSRDADRPNGSVRRTFFRCHLAIWHDMGMRIGVLHPGQMGAALATCLDDEVVWASGGRSEATLARAREVGISDLESLDSLVVAAHAVISVCPPGEALGLAEQVSKLGFGGLYIDVNAVSPATARRIDRLFARFVDGGIVGPPPNQIERFDATSSGTTRLYLSGEEAGAVADLFAGSALDARVIGGEPGQASAVKMAYAAWTKGSSALLLSVAALATSEDVLEELFDEWEMSIPELRQRLERVAANVGAKAWRFVGEMEEIAQSYRDAGLPDAFHLAAGDLYSRLEVLKDHPPGRPQEIVKLLLPGE